VDKFPPAALRCAGAPPLAGLAGPAVSGRPRLHHDFLRAKALPSDSGFDRLTIAGKSASLPESRTAILWKHEYDCAYAVAYTPVDRAPRRCISAARSHPRHDGPSSAERARRQGDLQKEC